MPKHSMDIQTVRELHRAGLLEEAKQGYLAVLRVNPRNAEMLHGLGILYTQKEHFSEAISYLEKAMHYQPNDPSIALHLANVYKIQGAYSQAVALLEKIIRSYPHYAAAYNNLGTVYFAEEKFDLAVRYYRQSIEKNVRYADAYYNLGLALAKNQEFTAAIETYHQLLQQVPDHFAARFQLANVYMQQNNVERATQEFLTIEAAQPFHFETQTNLATCYLKKGALNEAKDHYLKALGLRPTDFQILFNLGVINMQQGQVDAAIEYYQRAVAVTPSSFDAQNNLGVAYLAKQQLHAALHHFKEALRIQPNNQAIAYTVTMLSQNQPVLSAPAEYVQSLFDSYADHYEPHLLKTLEYKVPAIFYEMGHPTLASFERPLDILDLGCGTGLCGAYFKNHAKHMTGVDLSPKMLAEAALKKIYDQLIVSDVVAFLDDKVAHYDLILAGDVLVYIGDLAALFKGAYTALRPQGSWIFNAEISDTVRFKMDQSGRFCHSKKYLDELATANRFKIISYQIANVRLHHNRPVNGHVYVLQKYDKF